MTPVQGSKAGSLTTSSYFLFLQEQIKDIIIIFRSFVDSCLKANKLTGPDGYMNECVKTMSHAELEVLRAWAIEILAVEKARVMTVEEMNGTISLLHKGGVTEDKPQDGGQWFCSIVATSW